MIGIPGYKRVVCFYTHQPPCGIFTQQRYSYLYVQCRTRLNPPKIFNDYYSDDGSSSQTKTIIEVRLILKVLSFKTMQLSIHECDNCGNKIDRSKIHWCSTCSRHASAYAIRSDTCLGARLFQSSSNSLDIFVDKCFFSMLRYLPDLLCDTNKKLKR